jgi:transposase
MCAYAVEVLPPQTHRSGLRLAEMLLKYLDGILNYRRTKVRFGVVEAINGNIRMLINRERGYKSMPIALR